MKDYLKSNLLALFSIAALGLAAHCSSREADTSISSAPMMSFTALLQKRHSGRMYDPARPVTQEQLRALAEAGRLAPSSYYEQPWRFILCDRATNPDAYDKAFNALVEFNQGWAKNAPVLIVVVAAGKSAHNGKDNLLAPYDSGAAAFSMMLEATSLGLMAHQMGGFDPEKIIKNFAIPQDFTPMAVMAIGYEVANPTDAAPKSRKPLSENFYEGAWGHGLKD